MELHIREEYICEECKKTYKKKKYFELHVKSHFKEPLYLPCEYCAKAFKTKPLLHKHISNNHGYRKLSCDICNKRFRAIRCLKTHMRSHTGEKPFVCEECSKTFSQKSHLTRHMKIHSGEKTHLCELCSRAFTQKIHLTNHLISHKNNKLTVAGERPNRRIKKNTLVKRKRYPPADDIGNRFTCKSCSKPFPNMTALIIHTRVHTGEKPFSCEVCNKKFSQNIQLRSHTRTHTGEKPYSCKECSKNFGQKIALINHSRLHTGDKPFLCEYCSKAFRHQSNLLRHKRTLHAEQYLASLKAIKEMPTEKKTLDIVKSADTIDEVFGCQDCTKTFALKFDLESHAMVHNAKKALSYKESKKISSPITQIVSSGDNHFTTIKNEQELQNFKKEVHETALNDKETNDNEIAAITSRTKIKIIVDESSTDSSTDFFTDNISFAKEKEPESLDIKPIMHKMRNIKTNILEADKKEPYVKKSDPVTLKIEIAFKHPVKCETNLGSAPTEQKPFPCLYCSKTFENKRQLSRHTKSSHGVRKFVCEVCKKMYGEKNVLEKHMRSHTGEKPYLCEKCSRSFSQLSHLQRHVKMHNGDKSHACLICPKKFSQNIHLSTHMTLIHPDAEIPKKVRRKIYLRYPCKDCPKMFPCNASLVIHMRSHTGEKPFGCELCNKRYSQKIHLLGHMRVHTGEKPFGCKVCDKSFRHKLDLTCHTRIHTGEQPFICEYCSKAFRHQCNLLRHKTTRVCLK